MTRACIVCGWAGLPVRDVCPVCAGIDWEDATDLSGTVCAVTCVHRAFGTEFAPPEVLILVILNSGGWIVGTGSNVNVGDTVAVGPDRSVRLS